MCKLHQEVSQALEPFCERIKQALPKQDILNVDETGWKSMGKRIWLWVFVDPDLTFFMLAASGGAEVLKGVLGEVFNGIILSDMFSTHNAYHKGKRQICWAHIIRSLKGLKHACRSPDGVRLARPNRVFTRAELLDLVQGYGSEGYERTIDLHIKNLRKKIAENFAEQEVISMVHGIGYKLGVIPHTSREDS